MNINQWKELVPGDKVVYTGKPNEIWEIDHAASCSEKKSWVSHGDHSTPYNGGGGECPQDGICIRMSIIRPRGRGMKRLSMTFSDPAPWTKI